MEHDLLAPSVQVLSFVNEVFYSTQYFHKMSCPIQYKSNPSSKLQEWESMLWKDIWKSRQIFINWENICSPVDFSVQTWHFQDSSDFSQVEADEKVLNSIIEN